jgi:hypothetical protein
MLTFGEALESLKEGNSILRYSSDIELKEITFIKTGSSMGFFQLNYSDYAVPYLPSFEDLMAEDWYIICKRHRVT